MAPVALVTGAAHGIGRAVVERLVRQGWEVTGSDVDVRALESLSARTAELDVTDADAWTEVLAGFDRLDLLVNNAGLLSSGPFADTAADRHRAIVEVNVLGVVHGALAAFPLLAATPGAAMVNLGSASAMYGQPDLATYSATKFAIRGLTEALDVEWAAHDIRVLDLWPAFVDTGMIDGLRARSADRLGIRLTPDDVASALVGAVAAARRRPASARWRNPHVPVGGQARLLSWVAQVSPHRVSRLITTLTAGRGEASRRSAQQPGVRRGPSR